ncbi:MAG: ATP-binding protein [Candidatus Margulisbacteria bacterium]|jgi:predicted AAA+ superfamily ATPase|nr:ATP-binding protein [Candidatus Margulisiibacteriota bacterium]
MVYYKRFLAAELEKTLNTRPLVYLNGPRQTGKSTLVQHISAVRPVNYIALDAPLVWAAVKNDPAGFLDSLPADKLNVLDEAQNCPELFPYLKIAIDRRRGGKNKAVCLYLLTGSANLLALPRLAESLVGRMSVLKLLPFAAAEYFKKDSCFVEQIFSAPPVYKKYPAVKITEVLKKATYPELALQKKLDRQRWLDDYLNMILQRDVKMVSDIRNPEKIISLLSVLAARAGGLLNNSSAAMDAGLDLKTYDKYKAGILNTFLAFEIKPWSPARKFSKRFVKAAKFYFTDTNLLAYLLKRDLAELSKDQAAFGHVLENFTAAELLKQTTSRVDISLWHFRTADQKEADFVLERTNGEIVGVEVKSAKMVNFSDTKGLQELKKMAAGKFKRGIVLYAGSEILPLGSDIWAMPFNGLWE